MDIAHSIRTRGGAAATRELHADGFGRDAITRALKAGEIIRARQGWYVERACHPALAEAVRVGGRLTCSSALRLHGIWVAGDRDLHVTVSPRSCQLRRPRDRRRRLRAGDAVVIHWTDRRTSESRVIVDPIEALADLIHCAPPELAAASAESLLHQHPRLRRRLASLIDSAPARASAAFRAVDGRSESGTEFLFRFRIGRYGLLPEPQVRIPGVGRVDFVIGSRLVIEVDGADYHTDRERFEGDRRRDALLSALGFRVLRFSHNMVLHDWATVADAVLAAVARGDHH